MSNVLTLIQFVVAMTGVALISFNGSNLELNPMGDLLAVLVAFVWACLYEYLATAARVHNFTAFGKIVYHEMGLERFADVAHLWGILYLGLGASVLCFVTWNLAVKAFGAVKTSIYICMVPVITVLTSVLILKEPLMWISIKGTVLAVAGLFLSEYSGKGRENRE